MFMQTSTDLPNTENPLTWWLMNRKVYPNLAKLMISIHTAMASSVVVNIHSRVAVS
ncbi:hypothetical protein BT96DRAFT_596570 [Gymnopus androsaceus JB14]|uniref:HAT C-terminal dimerisation domain-containing protein n=1 Tax=Gymnopus androsaceus JB14 TaxID=1447944 RepID=A0A6A4GII2_9AGAR|nr:hypothetical protein BT96DRAFT_596570 [Gymnopus androsaceus JB14]